MLTCPDCKSVNPSHHNFCQGCGRSLAHHNCPSCGSDVDFHLENCPKCHAVSGTYRWAVIELVAGELDPAADVVNSSSQADHHLEIPVELPARSGDLGVETAADRSIATMPAISTLTDLETEVAMQTTASSIGLSQQPESNPWDDSIDLTTSGESAVEGDGVAEDEIRQSSVPSPVYLDTHCRYRLLDPVVIQLLTPNDSSQVRIVDCQPFRSSPLETLMEQEPIALDSITPNQRPEEYQQWQFWNTHGVPKIAQAYIALQVSLPGTIPPIQDSWNNEGRTVTVVEDRSNWMLFVDRCKDLQIPNSQVIYWLDYTLKLWVALEPWQMRQSLLEPTNLLVDEDDTICFQRLYPEVANSKLKLIDLARLWRSLYDRSGHTLCEALDQLIQAMEAGELARVEEVRSRLQQIAYELEPKQLSAPLEQIVPSEELSKELSAELIDAHDAPTIALARRLVNLEEAAATHVGRKRDHNEDCFGIVSRVERQHSPRGQHIAARGLYILCDGMGGHDGGEIASAMTVDLLREYFFANWGDTLPDEQTIREGIINTNEAVFEINQKNSTSGSGRMGTTLVLVLVQDQNIAVAHVGDSRCYAVTPTQGLIQLTVDHEVGQQQILRGVDPEIAYGRPDSYQLTQAIGPRDRNYIAPDIKFFELQEDTLIILASDGLTDNQLMETHWLTNVAPLLSTHSNLQQGVDRLIDFANEYNGHDNITALLVRTRLG